MVTTDVVEDDKSQELSILFKKEKFADFILNFLGKKERINYEESITYLINHNDLEQFYYLIEAKIKKERNIVLDHFLVSISYNDNTNREIAGIEALKIFQETRYVYPVSVTLTWNLILSFPESDSIENQMIDLTFLSSSGNRGNDKDEGQVILNISHTNQVWGIEILNLLKDKIQDVCIIHPKPYYVAGWFKRKFPKDVFVFLGMIIALGAGFMFPTQSNETRADSNLYYLVAENIVDENVRETKLATLAIEKMNVDDINKVANNLIKTPSLKQALEQISANTIKREKFKYKAVIGAIFLFVTIFLLYLYPDYALKFYGCRSHILITKRAESNRNTELEGKNKVLFISLTLILSTIVLGLITNWVTIFLGF